MAGRRPSLCTPFDRWPAIDRDAWTLGCTPGDPFDDAPHHGAALAPPSRHKIRQGYARWLHFLDQHDWLDPALPPLERVTEQRLWTYFQALQEAGNAPHTIIGRFAELRTALQILVPGADVGWVVRPGGRTVYSRLRKTRRHKPLPDSGVLFKWAIGLMERADEQPTPLRRCIAFRDGLLLAMLASRARRRRAMHGVSVGRQLVWRGGTWRIEIEAGLVKTQQEDAFDLPARLMPYVERYLREFRPLLLGSRVDDALWLNYRGERLAAATITGICLERTKERFGIAVSPHDFRRALATTAALRCSDDPGLAAAVMGISPGVVEEHYNRAGQIHASRKLTALVERRRRAAVTKRPATLPPSR